MSAMGNTLPFDDSAAPALAIVPRRTLWEHTREVNAIIDLCDQLDQAGELDEGAFDRLSKELIEAIAGTKEKIDGVTATLAAFEANEAAAKAERDRLADRAKYFARQTERLESYCLAVLGASNLTRMDGHTSSIQSRRNPPRVQVDDAGLIPWEFYYLPPEPVPPDAQPDKTRIREALKADPAAVPGARLIQEARLIRS